MARRRRRRGRRVDWFEVSMVALGSLFLGLAAVSVFAAVVLAVSFGGSDAGFPAGEGFLKTIKGMGIGLFATAAVVCYGVADWLLGERLRFGVRKMLRRRRDRR